MPPFQRFRSLFALRKQFPDGKTGRTYFGVAVLAAQIYAAAHVFNEYFYTWSQPYGGSMFPTLDVMGELLVVSRLYKRGKGIQVGDMVTFKHPLMIGQGALKRVVGMPGDYVLLNSPGSMSEEMIQVPEGHCFVAGDCLNISRDSRMFGPIPLALIHGKPVFRLFPFKKAGFLENTLEEVVGVD